MTIITATSPFNPQQPSHIKVPLFQHQFRVLYAAKKIEEVGYVPLKDDEELKTTVGFICCPPGNCSKFLNCLYKFVD